MGRVRITRPFVLLALAALMAPRAEASRTSVWESNPPAASVLAKTDASGLLASRAPTGPLESIVADAELVETPRFNLGGVVLIESEVEHEDRFGLGPLDLLGPTPLRGPPSSYPETRVRGFELLPPFRGGASPSLSLWSRRACGFSCREVASDSRYDPWGLAVSATKKGVMIASEELLDTPIEHFSWDWAAEHPDQFYALLTKRGGMNELEAGKLMADNGVMPGGQAGREFFVRQVSRDSRQLEDEATELWTSGMLGLGVDRAVTAAGRKVAATVAERQLAKEAIGSAPVRRQVDAAAGGEFADDALRMGEQPFSGGPRLQHPIDLPTAGRTPEEVAAMREYASRTNAWLAENGPQRITGTKGPLRRSANASARAERLRAARAGTPYKWKAGHVPDTAVSGQPNPPAGWQDMPGVSNDVCGGVLGCKVGQLVDHFTIDGKAP